MTPLGKASSGDATRWRLWMGVVALVVAVSCPREAFAAALAWEKREQSLRAEPGQGEVRAAFVFRNQRDRPVTITGVETTCGCTTAGLDKSTYEPGEAGFVQAVFSMGDLFGTQEKKIFVRTDVPGADTDTLIFRVTIQEPVALSRTWLVWNAGEDGQRRTIQVGESVPGALANLTLLEGDPGFEVDIVPVKPASDFEVRVQPKSAAGSHSAKLRFRAHAADGKTRDYAVFAYVK